MKTLSRRDFLKTAAIISALGLAGCGNPGQQENSGDGDSEALKFDGNFIVGFDQEFPPYGFIGDDGEPCGFDLDLAAAVCEMKGWTYTPNPIDWNAKDGLLNSGAITCIWNGFTIEGRESDYAFTDAYMNNSNVVVVAADSDIQTLADLTDKNVVVQTDSGAQSILEGEQADLAATFASLQTIGEYNTAFMMLEQGTYDAIAVDEPVAHFNIEGKEDVFRILEEPLNSEHYGVGFALGNEELAAEVQAAMQELDANGTVEATCEKYGLDYANWCLPKA